jgi:hypothetical protein
MSGKVVLGTHLLGSSLSAEESEDGLTLGDRFRFMQRIAEGAGLSNYGFLVLKQPAEEDRHTIAEREHDKKAWEAGAVALGNLLTLIYDFHYVPGAPPTLAWNILHRYAFTELQADRFVYIDPGLSRWDQTRREAVENRISSLISQPLEVDYLIGDYKPVPEDPTKKTDNNVRIKIAIEEYVKNLLKKKFSALMNNVDVKRPRSEFHAISKRLYDDLIE